MARKKHDRMPSSEHGALYGASAARGDRDRAIDKAIASYTREAEDYISALESRGVEFAPRGEGEQERANLRAQLESRGAEMRNAGASIRVGWLSPACEACTGPVGSETFSTTFKCHRGCYFCFNHNVSGYEDFVREGCPWREGLDDAVRKYGGGLDAIGLTGGEPLLDFENTIAFLERASELFPAAHKRMYTSGDLLTEEKAHRLRDAGLREIRFSVKDFDPLPQQQKVLEAMELAKRYIPNVMVEMPVVPGTRERMRELLLEFGRIGIDGINMLEFCFPFNNWDQYAVRGFKVRNLPFDVMYDYGYSGGLPIAGSEELALELMLWCMDEGMEFGMHYCSLDNKHRSEMRQRNEPAARANACYSFDHGDFFLKACKVFGRDDRDRARGLLAQLGFHSTIESLQDDSTAFPLRYGKLVENMGAKAMCSIAAVERIDAESFIREIDLRPFGR